MHFAFYEFDGGKEEGGYGAGEGAGVEEGGVGERGGGGGGQVRVKA